MDAVGAVRTYLMFVKDASALVDQELITKLEGELEQATDPLDELRVHQQLLQAREPDRRGIVEAFIEHAKQWADEQNIVPEAFQEMGVEDEILRRAGFDIPEPQAPRPAAPGKRRQRRVKADEIRTAIRRTRKRTFNVADMVAESGGTSAPVRRVIYDLVAEGALREIGQDPDHSGVGRAPTLYQKV